MPMAIPSTDSDDCVDNDTDNDTVYETDHDTRYITIIILLPIPIPILIPTTSPPAYGRYNTPPPPSAGAAMFTYTIFRRRFIETEGLKQKRKTHAQVQRHPTSQQSDKKLEDVSSRIVTPILFL